MPTLQSVDRITQILADRAYGPGLNVPEIRRLYPAKDVRRTTVVQTLAHLERLGLVRWRDGRVWWTGPIPPTSRPLGRRAARIVRYETTTPAHRVDSWIQLQRDTKAMARRTR